MNNILTCRCCGVEREDVHLCHRIAEPYYQSVPTCCDCDSSVFDDEEAAKLAEGRTHYFALCQYSDW